MFHLAGGNGADNAAGTHSGGADDDDFSEDWGELAASKPSPADQTQAGGSGNAGAATTATAPLRSGGGVHARADPVAVPVTSTGAAVGGGSSVHAAAMQGGSSAAVGAEPGPSVGGSDKAATSVNQQKNSKAAGKGRGQNRMVPQHLLTLQQQYSSVITCARSTADINDILLFDKVSGLGEVLTAVVSAIKGTVTMQRVTVSDW